MATKTVTEIKPPAKPALADLIDELGQVEHYLEPHRIAIAREDKLRAAIRAEFDAQPADREFEAVGQRFTVILGARALTKIVDNKKAFKALGQSVFTRIAKLTLAAIERECTPVDAKAFVREERSGTRSLRIFRRAVTQEPEPLLVTAKPTGDASVRAKEKAA